MKKIITIPTVLTVARIIITPIIAWALYNRCWTTALVLFVISGLTDLADGFLARLLKQESRLGALLDPVADKFFIITVMGILLYMRPQCADYVLIQLFFGVVLCKELLLIAASSYFLTRKKRFIIRPTLQGKISMAMQTVAIFTIIFYIWIDWSEPIFINGLLLAALSIVLISGVQYAFIGWTMVRKNYL